MSRTCLEKQKPINSYNTGKETNGKRSIGRSKMRWEDVVKKDVEQLGRENNWKARTADRERWKAGCMTAWSWRPQTPKKKKKFK
jgi:hypothetical protein